MARQISIQFSWVNYLSIAIALAALVFSVFSWADQKTDKIVYVDALKLITKYKGLESARKNQQIKRELWKARLDTLESEFKVIVDDYNSKKGKLSKNQQASMEEAIKSKREIYFNYQQSFKDETKKQDDELSRQILNRVNDYLKRYGEKSKYKVILAATQLGSIAYAHESLDITDEVLIGLNKEYDLLNKK